MFLELKSKEMLPHDKFRENTKSSIPDNKKFSFKENLLEFKNFAGKDQEINLPTKKVRNQESDDGQNGNSFHKKNELFQIQERQKNPHPILEEFFMISSKSFLNREIFPAVKIDNKKYWTIKTDRFNYRINDAWSKAENNVKGPTEKFFYFRLSGLNLYYTNTNSDMNVLGVISVKSMDKIQPPLMDGSTEYITTCFVLTDIDRIQYKICGMDENVVKHWYCQIKAFLGQKDPTICKEEKDGVNTVTKEIHIDQPYIIVPLASPFCNDKWNYNNFGDDWECDCKEGKEQSPIDLPKIEETIKTDVAPLFRYNKVKAPDQKPTVDGKSNN